MNRLTIAFLITLLLPSLAGAYPLDGYKETGIRRVEGARMANEGIVPGRKQPAGALLSTDEVDLRLLDYRDMDLPVPDPAFSKQLVKMLGSSAPNYGIAVQAHCGTGPVPGTGRRLAGGSGEAPANPEKHHRDG